MDRGLYINLIPPEVHKKRKAEKGLLFLLALIAVFVGVLLTVSFAFGMKVSQEEAALAELKTKTSALDKEIAKYNVFNNRKEAVVKHEESIKKALEKQLFWHKFLNELSMIVPVNVSVSKLTLSNDQISLSALAFNHQDVAEFMVRMMDLDELKDVWIDGSKDTDLEEATYLGQGSSSGSDSSSSNSSGTGVEGVEFTLTAKLKNPGPDVDSSSTTGTGSGSQSSGSSSGSSNGSNSNSSSGQGSQ